MIQQFNDPHQLIDFKRMNDSEIPILIENETKWNAFLLINLIDIFDAMLAKIEMFVSIVSSETLSILIWNDFFFFFFALVVFVGWSDFKFHRIARMQNEKKKKFHWKL